MPTPTKKPPIRFGYITAAIVGLGFAGFAAWPYLATAAERLAQGQPVTAEAVKKDVAKAGKEQEMKMEKDKAFEPKSVLPQADGTALVGGKQGLMEWRDGKLAPVAGFAGMEVRGLAAGRDGTLWAAAKDGLWKRTGAEWKNVREGDFWSVAQGADGALFLAGKMGVLRSADGAQWEPLPGTATGWKPEPKDGHGEHEKGGKKDGEMKPKPEAKG